MPTAKRPLVVVAYRVRDAFLSEMEYEERVEGDRGEGVQRHASRNPLWFGRDHRDAGGEPADAAAEGGVTRGLRRPAALSRPFHLWGVTRTGMRLSAFVKFVRIRSGGPVSSSSASRGSAGAGRT